MNRLDFLSDALAHRIAEPHNHVSVICDCGCHFACRKGSIATCPDCGKSDGLDPMVYVLGGMDRQLAQDVHEINQQTGGKPAMAGEIRQRLDKWRQSKAKMLAGLDGLLDEAAKVHGDTGAIELGLAEVRATKAELAEFQAEFAQSTNGPPLGNELPGSKPGGG